MGNGLLVDTTRYNLPAIRVAADITYAAFRAIPEYITHGINERQLAWRMGRLLQSGGSHKRAFPVIVAFGENAAEPHHVPTSRKLQFGDIVKIDAGAVYDNMRGDVTRTYLYHRSKTVPSVKFKRRYQAVLAAQHKAMPFFTAGTIGSDIDKVARQYLRSKKMHTLFIHSLGHGVGRAIHQPPWITPSRRGNRPLRVGEVVTNEPGIYQVGWGGIRIEDMVEITRSGPKVMGDASSQYEDILISE